MNPKLPVLKPKKVIHALERAGFYIHHQSGSHAQLKHPLRSGVRITIPIHGKDIPQSVIRNIIRQAGMTVEEFMELL